MVVVLLRFSPQRGLWLVKRLRLRVMTMRSKFDGNVCSRPR
jgi:hypothetical protein